MNKITFNIVVADDDQNIRFIVSTILRRQGHTVEVAENGEEAIKLFALKPYYFNILITDHNMPLVTGLDLVYHLRKNGVDVKIIVMSGSLTGELMRAYQNKLVDNILQKPFRPEDFSSALNDIFKQWRPAAVVNVFNGSIH